MYIGYINVFVTDFDRALEFYTDVIGLTAGDTDAEFGYASFTTPAETPRGVAGLSFAIAKTDDTALTGKHTGIGFITKDIEIDYQRMLAAGVKFETPPTKQPWGGTLALFWDPDNNTFYLDPGHS